MVNIKRKNSKHIQDYNKNVLDAIPNPVFIKSIYSDTIDYNKAFAMVVNNKTKKIKLTDLSKIIGEDIISEIREIANKALKCNEPQQHNIVINKSYDGIEEGNERNFLFNIAPYTDEQGNTVGIVGFMTDITHIKRVEEKLRQSDNKYIKLIQTVLDIVLIHEGDIITFISDSGVKMVGYGRHEEIIGKSIFKFVHKDSIDIVKKEMEKAKNNLNVSGLPFELKIISKDGRIIDAEAINIGFMAGSNVSIMVVIRDITERKRTEELEKTVEENARLLIEAIEYDKIKNEFFANISHEFRTPLNVILGVLQLLVIYSDKEAGRFHNMDRYINIMKQNCFRLLRLVNNLIDITKIDSGFFQIKLESISIVRIVGDITLSVAHYAEEKGITLEFHTNVEEKIINCDPDQIERILLNLLSNSIKFTSSGGKISVFLDDKGDSIVIRVKDTGIGIPEDKQEFIFERFRQVDKSLNRDHEGSGIGLSLVKSLVEMHGGTINVISREGVGSEFIIEIPVDENLIYNGESVVAEGGNIERIKIEFSDIYSI